MVHSGSSSPMKTTPSASPHLPVPATAPPLPPAPPLVPPSVDTREQGITQTPSKLTASSDLTQLSTPTPADAETPVTSNSNPTSASTQTPNPTQSAVNGRTSGRKRTPKSCDCCGPNSTGHNVRPSGRGRGRARGRGKGASRDLLDTPKRKDGGLLTSIKKFDLTNETVDEDEDGTIVSQSQTSLDLHISQQDGPIRNCVSPEKRDMQKEEGLIDGSEAAGTGGSEAADSSDVEKRALEMKGMEGLIVRGSRGRGAMGAQFASKIEANIEIKSGSGHDVVISSSTNALSPSVLVLRQGNSDAEMQHVVQTDLRLVKAPFENGDIINLSENGPEEDAKDDSMTITQAGNGPLSISELSGCASKSGISQDVDSVMQVDQSPDRTDSVSAPLTLSNGNTAEPTDHNHETTPMEVETSHPGTGSSPSRGPISMCSMDHPWALRDHRLYCHPGTWEMEKLSSMDQSKQTDGQESDEKIRNEENLEQLIDMVHEFLESFYIKYGSFSPLSETDVLEYLKKKGNSDLTDKGLDIRAEVSRYRAGLASAPVAGFMVTYNKHNLSLEDLGTLEEQNWLNDQIINMYGELIMDATQHKVHFFNSFFHKQLVAKGYDGVKRWTKKVDLFSKWLLLIPIHLEIHWSLVTVAMATKTINYYDSQGIVFRHTTDNIMKYLQSEAREKKQAAFQKGWKITIIKGIPQQKNDSDCGVFVLEYCRCLSVKQPLLFSQEDMPRIRKRIYKELCDCRLND